MDYNIYTVVIDFYESTARWGTARWFYDIKVCSMSEDGMMKLIDIHNTIHYVPPNNNIANITVTLNEKEE